MRVLVTGGLGFIGSHTVVELLNNNYEVIVIDNLSNSSIDVYDKIKTITGKDFTFYQEDLCDEKVLENIFSTENIDSVIRDLCRDFTGSDMVKTNYDNYNLIRNGRKVEFKQNGKQTFDFVKLIDFENPENNIFTAVSQMWIQGQYIWRRPDVIIFVNGLPLVFARRSRAWSSRSPRPHGHPHRR